MLELELETADVRELHLSSYLVIKLFFEVNNDVFHDINVYNKHDTSQEEFDNWQLFLHLQQSLILIDTSGGLRLKFIKLPVFLNSVIVTYRRW